MPGESQALSTARKGGEGPALLPEIVEVLRREGGGQVNINILLQQVAEKTESPELALKHFDEAIKLSEKYEDHRLRTFRALTEAIIETKANDPDEIEKRSNNRIRRWLKAVIAGSAVVGIAGTLLSVVSGGSIVVTGLLAAVGVVALAMLGPLASGESVSSNDVVRMVTAVGDVLGRASSAGGSQRRQRERKGR